jgi:hypothetical protein
MARWRVWTALVAWLVAVAFIGPGHVALHHHDAPDACDACGAHDGGPAWEGLCSVPDCPEPTHHHHGTPHDDALTCVACATVSLAPPPALTIAVAPTPVARVALFGDRTGIAPAVGRPRARAPPADC